MSIELHSDEQLMFRINNDDEQALEMLFRKYYPALVRFAKEIVKSKDQAEDMVQEVFVKIWDKRKTITVNTQAKSYLFVAVKNHCFNQLKLNERKYWMEDGMEDDIRISTTEGHNRMDEKNLEHQIRTAIDALPPKCGLIFKMSRFEEKTYKEIAETLGLSVKTIENQMGKALSLMRTSLAPYMLQSVSLVLSVFFTW
jgi:RNA polymerase sigma-70 factor (ECF subfamily)